MADSIDPFNIRARVPEFAAIQAAAAAASETVRAELRHVLDIPYGDAPRQRLDLFFPNNPVSAAPVHMFVHGGYWRANDRENFAYIARTVTDAGAIAVIAEYTLMPAARMAQLVGEVRQAAAWVHQNIAGYGGDPHRFSVSGHSAGAHLAFYLAAKAPHETAYPDHPPKALLLVSGIYDLRPITESFLQAELHLTDAEVADWSPFEADPAPGTAVTLVVGHGETEPFHLQAQDLAHAAARRGVPMERITVPDHDHMSIAHDLGVPGTRMAELLLETIQKT